MNDKNSDTIKINGIDYVRKDSLNLGIAGEDKQQMGDYERGVNDYKAYCQENGLDAKLPYPNPVDDNEKNTNAYEMMKTIVKNENGGKIPVPFDTNQAKFAPWFKPNPSGFGLSFGGYVVWSTYSDVPARLCSVESDNVKPISEKFISIYNILQIK